MYQNISLTVFYRYHARVKLMDIGPKAMKLDSIAWNTTKLSIGESHYHILNSILQDIKNCIFLFTCLFLIFFRRNFNQWGDSQKVFLDQCVSNFKQNPSTSDYLLLKLTTFVTFRYVCCTCKYAYDYKKIS